MSTDFLSHSRSTRYSRLANLKPAGELLALWMLIRIVSSIFASFVTYLRPLAEIEQKIALLPPTRPFSEWLYRALLSPWLRWDAVWFVRIVNQGYSATDGTAPYHPLYPWLARLLADIGISPLLSLLIISSLATIALFYVLYKLAQLQEKQQDAFFVVLLFAVIPISFVLFAPYSESLFLLWAALCLYWSRKKTWWLAGLAGGLAVLTRQQGIFLLFPMAIELWDASSRKISTVFSRWKDWLSLSLIPIGMLIWLGYRAIFLNDVQASFSNFQSFIFSFFISPSTLQVVSGQQFAWPWQAIYLAASKLFSAPDIDLWVNIIYGVLFLAGFAIAWKNLRLSYKIYSFVIVFISFSYYTGPVHPYMGLPRHLLLAFPVFIGLAHELNTSWKRLLAIIPSIFAWLFLLLLYELNAWVP